MNREELQRAIDGIEIALINKQHIEGWDFHQVRHEPLVTALAALREQQAREKGCDYCGLIYKLDGASYGTDSVIIKNRFCPMCGKRLEVNNDL